MIYSKNKVEEYLKELYFMRCMDLEETYEYVKIKNSLIDILSQNVDSTVVLLNSLNEEEIKIISGLLIDVSKRLNDKKLLNCIKLLEEKFPNINFSSIIFYCKLILMEE